MTQQQKELISPLLLALSQVKTMEQVDILWEPLVSSLRVAGIQIGSKPTSVPQAKSVAQGLRNRIL